MNKRPHNNLTIGLPVWNLEFFETTIYETFQDRYQYNNKQRI